MSVPFKPLQAAALAQGDFAVALLGQDHPDAVNAQANAVATQAYLIVLDDQLKATIPDIKLRGDKLFDAFKKDAQTPDELKANIVRQFPNVTDGDFVSAQAIVDGRAGTDAADHKAVPPFAPIFAHYIDQNLSKAILRIQTAMRMELKLATSVYPKTKVNPDFDGPEFADICENYFNPLIDKTASDSPRGTDQNIYHEQARRSIALGMELLKGTPYEPNALAFLEQLKPHFPHLFPDLGGLKLKAGKVDSSSEPSSEPSSEAASETTSKAQALLDWGKTIVEQSGGTYPYKHVTSGEKTTLIRADATGTDFDVITHEPDAITVSRDLRVLPEDRAYAILLALRKFNGSIEVEGASEVELKELAVFAQKFRDDAIKFGISANSPQDDEPFAQVLINGKTPEAILGQPEIAALPGRAPGVAPTPAP